MEQMDDNFKSGVVAVVGRPNVGKSSLINSLLRCKATIVSPKPQTTRDRIRCVYDCEKAQVVFADTPGIHEPKHKLGEAIVANALKGLEDADLVMYVISSEDNGVTGQDRHIISLLKETGTPIIVVINKVDLLGSKRAKLLPLIDAYQKKLNPAEVIPVSAKQKINLDRLLTLIIDRLPKGPPLYLDDMLVDRPARFIASEIIREQVLMKTEQEVPHSIAVEVLDYKTPDEYPERKDAYISAAIYVERKGQKLILLGTGGSKLKEIGSSARADLEMLTDCKVYLDLWVKIKKDWRNSDFELKRLGYKD